MCVYEIVRMIAHETQFKGKVRYKYSNNRINQMNNKTLFLKFANVEGFLGTKSTKLIPMHNITNIEFRDKSAFFRYGKGFFDSKYIEAKYKEHITKEILVEKFEKCIKDGQTICEI